MSDTPRTDEQVFPVYPGRRGNTPVVSADFARSLEREVAALRGLLLRSINRLRLVSNEDQWLRNEIAKALGSEGHTNVSENPHHKQGWNDPFSENYVGEDEIAEIHARGQENG